MTTAVTAAIVFTLHFGSLSSLAGDEPDALLNYSFAVWVGSGVYKVRNADKRFAVLRVPLAYIFRPAQYDQPVLRDRLGYRLLLPAVVLEDDGETERVNRIFNVGLTLGTREAVSIWKINFDRVGIDYRWGNAGFRGIGFNLGFPF